MQYSQEHLKTMVYAKFGGQTKCIMGNWKIENKTCKQKKLNRLMLNGESNGNGINRSN